MIRNSLWGTQEHPGFFRSPKTWGAVALITAVALAALGALLLTGFFTAQTTLMIGLGSGLLAAAVLAALLAIVLFKVKSSSQNRDSSAVKIEEHNPETTAEFEPPKGEDLNAKVLNTGTRNTGTHGEGSRVGADNNITTTIAKRDNVTTTVKLDDD